MHTQKLMQMQTYMHKYIKRIHLHYLIITKAFVTSFQIQQYSQLINGAKERHLPLPHHLWVISVSKKEKTDQDKEKPIMGKLKD